MQIDTSEPLLARANRAAPIAEIARFVALSHSDVYLVGGAVRDLLLARPFIDVDLAVDGDASELAATLGASLSAQTRFGTFSARRGEYRYDLARTRTETYERPGALPEVQPAGIDADLARRDFTINAIALGLSGSRTGELLAAPGALDDLSAGRLAVLHDQSFIDDPTRLLRLARYAARLGFEPSTRTRELATAAIGSDALTTISGIRIGNELRLLATEPDPVAAFEAAGALGLPWTIEALRTRAALEALPADGRRDLLVLACVLTPDQLDELGLTAAERDAIADAITAPALAQRMARARSGAEIARAVGRSGIETVALASVGSPSQSMRWLRDLRHRTLEVTGNDLIRNGVPEGQAIGRALQAARDALMNDEARDRDSQLSVALKAAE